MKIFDEKNATADELWDYYMLEYQNQNPVAKILIDNYYSKIEAVINEFAPGYKLLEAGCGPGESSRRIASMLKGQYFEVSEFDERLVFKLRETKPEYKVSRESVYSLQRTDNQFDVVFLLEVLEHVDDYKLALKELVRVAEKYVVLSVPNEPVWSILNMMRGKYWKDLGNTPGHINRWSKNGFVKLVSQYGKVVRIYTPLPWTIILLEVKK